MIDRLNLLYRIVISMNEDEVIYYHDLIESFMKKEL